MIGENPRRAGLKRKVIHEFVELAEISLYLAFIFCAVATYKMLLLDEFRFAYFNYGTALINALVVAKVILIGEAAHLGKKQEAQPLFLSAIYKAFLFGVLTFGFHVVEEAIKQLVHGGRIAAAFQSVRIDDVLARCVVIFGTFLPLFGFLELRRVIGDEEFHKLLFRRGAAQSYSTTKPANDE
jgi:hypothetical protein